jgi:hypothetical protein
LTKRLTFAYSNCNIKSQCNSKAIIEDGLNTIKDRIKELEDRNDMVALFKPTKTALQAIKFLNKDNVIELKKCDEPLIKNIFKILNIINNNHDESESLINNFLSTNEEICIFLLI